MLRLSVDISNYARLIGAEFAAMKRGINKGLLEGAMRAIPLVQQSARTAPPANPAGIGTGGAVNTGAYLRSWRARRVQPSAGSFGAVSIYNAQRYGGVIEHGRRVGARMPPVEALARWAQRRLRLPRKEALRVGFAVARAIRRRGLRPRRVLDRVILAMREHVASAMNAQIERELQVVRSAVPQTRGRR